MTRTATIRDIEGALKTLAGLLPGQNLALERYGNRARIIRADHSTPFGSNYYTRSELYDILWFAIAALRLQKESAPD